MSYVLTILLLAGSVHAADVTVFMAGEAIVPNAVSYGARVRVTQMFAQIGVPLDWPHKVPAASEPSVSSIAIQAKFTTGTPERFHPGALAYAQPFDRIHVVTVLYDRLQTAAAQRHQMDQTLLAHVLAHEIGHILLGTDVHAESGIMKAHWSKGDYDAMEREPMRFTPLDQKMIVIRLHLAELGQLSEGVKVETMGLPLTAGFAFGQPGHWEQQMQDGDGLERAGRYREARAAYQLALQDEDAKPSDSGLRKATTLNNLALLNRYLGQYEDARQQYQRALALFEKACGPHSSEYASALHNLAVLSYQQRKLDDAVRQFRAALTIREEILGQSDPATAQTLNSLAAVFAGQKRYAEAERLCRRALGIEEKALGPEDPRVSATLDNLASLYRRRGQLETALDLSLHAHQIAQKAYGDQHPITCVRANKLAVLFGNLGRFPEAEDVLRRTLEIQLQTLGEENPDVAKTMANLAAVCFHRKHSEEAEALYRRALTILERTNVDDQNLPAVLSNYAWLLRHIGRKSEAMKLEMRAHTIHQNDRDRFTVDVSDMLSPHR